MGQKKKKRKSKTKMGNALLILPCFIGIHSCKSVYALVACKVVARILADV